MKVLISAFLITMSFSTFSQTPPAVCQSRLLDICKYHSDSIMMIADLRLAGVSEDTLMKMERSKDDLQFAAWVEAIYRAPDIRVKNLKGEEPYFMEFASYLSGACSDAHFDFTGLKIRK